jgi:NADP-dependent 3-hydroxy acid dehydrogenase YdfG
MTNLNKFLLINGASSGIGRACTEYLALQGYKIYAGARKSQDIEALNKIKNVDNVLKKELKKIKHG